MYLWDSSDGQQPGANTIAAWQCRRCNVLQQRPLQVCLHFNFCCSHCYTLGNVMHLL